MGRVGWRLVLRKKKKKEEEESESVVIELLTEDWELVSGDLVSSQFVAQSGFDTDA